MKMIGVMSKVAALIATLLLSSKVLATTYSLPSEQHKLIGNVQYISASANDTLLNIALRYDLGLNQIMQANPGVATPTTPLAAGTQVHLPAAFILPPLPQDGVVINLAEMRMYYYTGAGEVRTYPIGIGRIGKTIPLAHTAVVRKKENPVWIPPADIRAFNEAQGIELPKVMPPGPDNPLGPYAIYLKIPTYLIHSTIYPDSVGRRASFGCIRMHEADIKDFFPIITPGTSVTIVDMPTKVAWQENYLYLEAHPPLEERQHELDAKIEGVLSSIAAATTNKVVFVDWQLVNYLAEGRDGMPHEIGFEVSSS